MNHSPPPLPFHREEELEDIFDHYSRALRLCFRTIMPVFILLTLFSYFSSLYFGYGTSEQSIIYAKDTTIIGLVFFTILVIFMIVLFPLIYISRAIDKTLFSKGGNILTSSILEFGILSLLVVISLLLTNFPLKVEFIQ